MNSGGLGQGPRQGREVILPRSRRGVVGEGVEVDIPDHERGGLGFLASSGPEQLRQQLRDRDDRESDRRIAESIRNDLNGDDADRIHVRVRHGLVTLTGRVPREDDARKIIGIADTTPGVAATDDEIERSVQRF